MRRNLKQKERLWLDNVKDKVQQAVIEIYDRKDSKSPWKFSRLITTVTSDLYYVVDGKVYVNICGSLSPANMDENPADSVNMMYKIAKYVK